MDDFLILETTFLVDLERELSRAVEGPAQAFLNRHADVGLYITFTIAGELAAGTSLSDRTKWEDFIAPFQILPMTREVSWEFGKAYRYLQANGLLIGANDLWIAATALAHETPLVTRNEAHYRRVPDLRILSHAALA